MRRALSCVLLTLVCSSTFALADSAATVPTLPKVWTGVSADTSMDAVSAKNILHRLYVGEKDEVKGWNKYDGPATITVLRQEGRHLELQFKNPKYQVNEVGTLSEDGKQIIFSSKNDAGLFTINGDSITGCGYSSGSNGLFSHWLSSYSAWCDEYTTGSKPLAAAPPASTLPKDWTERVSTTSIGAVDKHNPLHEANVGSDKAAKDYNSVDEIRTLKIIRQEGRHIEALYKSPRFEAKWVGLISADGKHLQFAFPSGYVALSISEGKMSGCGSARGANGKFEYLFNNYRATCYDFAAGSVPPPEVKAAPILPKDWKGTLSSTNEGTANKYNPNQSAKGWNTYEGERTVTVTRQEGRHVEFLNRGGPDKNNPVVQKFVGVLSSDGKLLQATAKEAILSLNVSDKKMAGCAFSRGNLGTFEHWSTKYTAWCISLTATR